MGETPVEKLIQELIDAVNRNAQISGWEILTSICSVISLVAIVILLIERKEKKRPYLQITFELIRDNLVCLVLRNVGETPAILRKISFSERFVKQLPSGGQTHLRNRDDLSLTLYPNQQWVIDLDVISSTVFQYECHTLDVTLEYSKPGQNRRRYKETSSICFDDYMSFLVYISETDELRKAIKSMDSNIVKIGRKIEKALKIDTSSQVQTTSFARLQDEYLRTIVTGIPKQQANPGESDLSCDSSEKN